MNPSRINHCYTSNGIFILFFYLLLLTRCAPNSSSEENLPVHPDIKGEAISFLGDTLQRPVDDEESLLLKDSLLQEAHEIYLIDSTDLDNILWYGRRLAYLHRYKEAINVFSKGIHLLPNAPELYRHRGHRFITLRRLDDAIADLQYGIDLAQKREIEIEPDGIPNKLEIPLSNLHFNLYYHLGLAFYLKGDYPKAIETFSACQQYAINPDLKVAVTDWLYLSYSRAGDISSAKKLLDDIHPDMEIIENDGYLSRLLLYKGEKVLPSATESSAPSSTDPLIFATEQYGISCWLDLNGQKNEAASVRRHILSSDFWPAFGYIAAEADSARLIVQ